MKELERCPVDWQRMQFEHLYKSYSLQVQTVKLLIRTQLPCSIPVRYFVPGDIGASVTHLGREWAKSLGGILNIRPFIGISRLHGSCFMTTYRNVALSAAKRWRKEVGMTR